MRLPGKGGAAPPTEPSDTAQTRLGRRNPEEHGAAMTLLEPAGKRPDPALLGGFVPREAEDEIARALLRPCFGKDRETMLLLAFDGFGRLARMERAGGGTAHQCSIPPYCWRALLCDATARVLLAHNHPSGAAWPSEADARCTHEAAAFLNLVGIELADHLIFVESGHFSFRKAQLI